MSHPKVVLITGASSGVGQATARLLAQNGYKVFGTSRNPASAGSLSNVAMLALDVRSDESVAACMKAVLNRAGQLDVLVNNAGYELAGAAEEIPAEEAKAQFETNFFGVLRMVNAALPLMRERKAGQIINISSLAGLIPIPFMGIYSASKFALEGYTEALRQEVSPFNIKVSQIETGFLKSAMIQHRQVAAQSIDEYVPQRQSAFAAIREYEEKGPGPEMVAETILKIMASNAPRLRYLVGQEAKSISRLKRFLPEWIIEKGTRNTFRLDVQK